MGLLNKILKAGKKYGGPIAGQAVAGYVGKKASKESPILGALVETVVAPVIVEKLAGRNPVAGTAYDPARVVYKQPETAIEVQSMTSKEGTQTSSFKLSATALVLLSLMPMIQSLWDKYAATLPPNSWVVIVVGGVITIVYNLLRTLQQNNVRDNETRQVEAQAATEVAKSIPVAPEPVRPPELFNSVTLNDDGGTE